MPRIPIPNDIGVGEGRLIIRFLKDVLLPQVENVAPDAAKPYIKNMTPMVEELSEVFDRLGEHRGVIGLGSATAPMVEDKITEELNQLKDGLTPTEHDKVTEVVDTDDFNDSNTESDGLNPETLFENFEKFRRSEYVDPPDSGTESDSVLIEIYNITKDYLFSANDEG